MFGMRYPIDVFSFDATYGALRVLEELAPGNINRRL